jgi:hypothetical protein
MTDTRKPMARRRSPALSAPRLALTLATLALLSTVPRAATAQEFVFHVEPAAAFWLDEPQMTRFTPGVYVAFRPGVSLGRFVSLQLSYALMHTFAGEGFTDDGTAHFVQAGVRVRPFAALQDEADQLGGLFLDGNVGYVRTGDLDRFGFDFGLGYGFQVSPWFSIGPVVRYGQIVQADDVSTEDPSDGQFMTAGLSLSFGTTPAPKEEHVCPKGPDCVQEKPKVIEAVPCLIQPCPDADRDGICDVDDRCPNEIGPLVTLGCPVDPCSGKPLIVLVQFDYDSAGLPPTKDHAIEMDPMLDAVAEAIAKNPSCRVCVIGHASNEGSSAHNLDLSRRRSEAVQGYLTARGVEQSRIPTTGFGERCQIVPESSRIMNRRVEFIALPEGGSCPKVCSD